MAKAPPKQIKLSNEQCLFYQNVQLRGALLEQERAKLAGELAAWQAAIEKQHRCQMKDYTMNLGTGVCSLRVAPRVVSTPKTAAPEASNG